MAQNKPEHYRDESERKEVSTSLRMTQKQHDKIKEKADAKGQSISTYLIDAASKDQTGFTPALLVQMQNLLNDACKMAERNEPDEVDRMQKEMNKIWQKLT
ncbi:plasmid mobilization protein [Ruminococcus flavefaciens]|uniref:Mobilization protein n=1 Tax=Ruminococcus flavefaciens 007c TaxID=1341157 RepID=W7UIJ2_RUMFL|nr:hypothetical protein [Ruminococcus flavefaciens]EWM55076.1 hypothetical protein RF007C_05230 [Ruminococcus flavefaciens 007c]